MLCRLVQPWAGSRRIVCADSYYASVETAEALKSMGLEFIGIVKTATKKYPMEYLSAKELSNRGETVSLVRKNATGSLTMMAVLWMDRQRRYFITTTSSTLSGTPYDRVQWRQVNGEAIR